MANEVEIVLKAVDKASATLKKTQSSFAGIKDAAMGVAASLAIASGATLAAKKAYDSLIKPTIEYNRQMRDAAQATGMTTEDMSRFVQVADDMGISADSVTRALQLATKNGFAPSVSSLADLADKANAMSDPTKRAAMLAKLLGRNWAELDPVLQLGGKRIREMAQSIGDGLVVTEKEIRATEKLRLNIDELSDATQTMKLAVGQGLTEWLLRDVDTIKALNEQIRKSGEYGNIGAIDYYLRFRKLRDVLADRQIVYDLHDVRDALDGVAGAAADVPADVPVNAKLTVNGQEVSIDYFKWLMAQGKGTSGTREMLGTVGPGTGGVTHTPTEARLAAGTSESGTIPQLAANRGGFGVAGAGGANRAGVAITDAGPLGPSIGLVEKATKDSGRLVADRIGSLETTMKTTLPKTIATAVTNAARGAMADWIARMAD